MSCPRLSVTSSVLLAAGTGSDTALEQQSPVGLLRSMAGAGGPRLLLLEESPWLSKASPDHSALQTISVGAGPLFQAGTALGRCWL